MTTPHAFRLALLTTLALAGCGVRPTGPPISGNNPGPGAPTSERLLSEQTGRRDPTVSAPDYTSPGGTFDPRLGRTRN